MEGRQRAAVGEQQRGERLHTCSSADMIEDREVKGGVGWEGEREEGGERPFNLRSRSKFSTLSPRLRIGLAVNLHLRYSILKYSHLSHLMSFAQY